MRLADKFLMTAVVILGGMSGSAGRAEAAFVLTINQVGSDVVVNGSGTANLAALTRSLTNNNYNAVLFASGPALLVGATGLQASDDYEGISGPNAFGTGNFADASSGSGQHFGLNSLGAGRHLLNVPLNYVSGTFLNSTSTYANATLASLGVTPGVYVYTWGSGATADSMTIFAGQAAVPEPSSLILCGTAGVVGVGMTRIRRRLAS